MSDYTITKYKNCGVIFPVPQGKLANMLNSKMSYKRQGAEFMPNPAWAWVRLYNSKKGSFPWGFKTLVDDIMHEWMKYSGETFIYESYKPPQPEGKFNFNLRPYQLDAISALIKNNGGILCMPTGSGKTITAIEYLNLFKLKRKLIVVTTLDIKNMWIEKVRDYIDHCLVINYQNPLAKAYIQHSDIIVFDECHHVSAKSLYTLAMQCKTEAVLVGLSATPKREDGEDMRINGALGNIVYEISRRELIDQGYLSDAVVFYHSPKFDTRGDFALNYAELYDKHIVNNSDRNHLIFKSAVKAYNDGKKILILISKIEHGRKLFDMLHNYSSKIFCHGQSKDRYKDLTKYNIIIASNIFNEGIDLPELDVVILAAGGKSSIRITQQVGRVLRTYPNKKSAIIIDFKDDIPKYLNLHYKKRREILEEDFEVFDV